MLTIYGIPNCDTCRKARKWLEQNTIEYHFHDLRADGLDASSLERWAQGVDWKMLLNTRSTTWRSIPEGQRQDVDEKRALSLMLEHPTLVKRPVLEIGTLVHVGFSTGEYQELLL